MKDFFKSRYFSSVYLSLVIVLGATTLSLGWVAWVVAGNQAMSRAEHSLDQSLQNAEFNLEQEESDLSLVGEWLVNQNDFIALVRAHDSIGLTQMLEPLTQTGIVDVLTLSDTSGQVVVRVRENKAITQGDTILNQPGIKEALSGKSTKGVEPDEFGQLRGRFTLPVYDKPSTPPIGVLVIGFYFDGPFMQRSANGLAHQALVAFNDQIMVANSAGAGETWVEQSIPPEVARAEQEGRPSGIILLSNSTTNYLFKFRPLHFPATVPAGMYGAGISSEMIENERGDLFRAMGGWILLVVAAIAAGAFFIARAIAAPIERLQIAARQIAHGNLAEPLTLTRPDELGDLAQQLETIRARLSDALEPAAGETKPLVCGEIILDPRTHRVSVAGTPVKLSATEFNLTQYLILNRDTVVSASQIIANVWGYAADEEDDVVRMTISRLRKKIERDPAHPAALVTIPGAGYMLKSKA